MSNDKAAYKMEWQRRHRDAFKAAHGFSETSHYATGKMRLFILDRDGYKCIECGMTDAEHKEKWGRPITIDHKDKNKKNNSPENLRTMCLSCHGRKDLHPELREKKLQDRKAEILQSRSKGETYQSIADRHGCSISTVYKWVQEWEGGTAHE